MSIIPMSQLSPDELSLLGNNIYPPRRQRRNAPDERANRRVLSGVNRSLSALKERVDRLYPFTAKAIAARRKLAS